MAGTAKVAGTLWLYSQAGAFRFLSREVWEHLYGRIATRGWDTSSGGDSGWLQSELNPYPAGAFFSEASAKSFSAAVRSFLDDEASQADPWEAAVLTKTAELFSRGAVLIRSEPPRKTAGTSLLEVVYAYSCLVCGFLHSGSWLFNTEELDPQHIRSSVDAMLRFTYCPLCGSKDIVAVTFFLRPSNQDIACDFMAAEPARENSI